MRDEREKRVAPESDPFRKERMEFRMHLARSEAGEKQAWTVGARDSFAARENTAADVTYGFVMVTSIRVSAHSSSLSKTSSRTLPAKGASHVWVMTG